MGCTVCQKCYTGKCPWGIATSDPWIGKRINPDIASQRLVNLLHAGVMEIKDMMGGMGINAIESFRGNRLALRGVGLTETEAENLGRKNGRRIKLCKQKTTKQKSTQNTNTESNAKAKPSKLTLKACTTENSTAYYAQVISSRRNRKNRNPQRLRTTIHRHRP